MIEGKQRIHFDGPFYTGFFLDSGALLDAGYTLIQKKVEDLLPEDNWAIEGSSESGLIWATSYTSVYGGTPMVPISFMTHKPTSLIGHQSTYQDQPFTIVDVIFYFHDYGTGVYRIMVEVDLQREFSIIEYRHLIEGFSNTLNSIIDPLIETSTQIFQEALISEGISVKSYEAIAQKLKDKGSDFLPLRKSLWFHRIFHFECEDLLNKEMVTEEDAKPYFGLLFSSQQSGPKNVSLSPYAVAYPSFGYSLMIANTAKTPELDLDRMVDIAEYYYAASTLLDAILFFKFAEYSVKKSSRPKIKELELDLDAIKDLAEQLELFLLILKDSIINFSPSSILVWRNLEKEWYYIPILEALREKNVLLNEKMTELVESLSQKRSATLNRFVKVFTLFAILGPLIEAYTFFQDTGFLNELLPQLLSLNAEIYLLIAIPIGIVGILIGVFITRILLRY